MAGLGLGVGWEIELNFLMATICPSSFFVPKGFDCTFWQNITRFDQLIRNVDFFFFFSLVFAFVFHFYLGQTAILLLVPIFLLLRVVIITAIYCMEMELGFERRSVRLNICSHNYDVDIFRYCGFAWRTVGGSKKRKFEANWKGKEFCFIVDGRKQTLEEEKMGIREEGQEF